MSLVAVSIIEAQQNFEVREPPPRPRTTEMERTILLFIRKAQATGQTIFIFLQTIS